MENRCQEIMTGGKHRPSSIWFSAQKERSESILVWYKRGLGSCDIISLKKKSRASK